MHPEIDVVGRVTEFESHHKGLITALAAGRGTADVVAVEEQYAPRIRQSKDEVADLRRHASCATAGRRGGGLRLRPPALPGPPGVPGGGARGPGRRRARGRRLLHRDYPLVLTGAVLVVLFVLLARRIVGGVVRGAVNG